MYLQTILVKPASSQCSMSCDYCFYCDEAAKRTHGSYGIMAEDTLRNLIKKSLFQAVSHICFAFQGGEPTLCGLHFFENVIAYEQQYNRRNVKILNTLQTNGLHLDESWCKFFKDHEFLIGISLDGTQETHDQCRHTKSGLPTYDRVRSSILLLEKYQVEFNILTVVNAYTAPHIRDIYTDYKRNGWKYQQYIPCLAPLGEEAAVRPYTLTPKLYGEFLCRLFDLWYKDWKRGKAPYIRDFENYIGILLGHLPEACSQRGVCSIQGVAEADGSVYPCDFYALDEYRLGNFNEHRVAELLESEKARLFIAESQKTSSVCRACEYYILCRGGCRRTRVKDPGTDTYRSCFCESYRTFFGYAGSRMREIAKFLAW